MTVGVLDSWAVLAWLQNEMPAAGEVQKLLDAAAMSTIELHMSLINAGEVYYRLAKDSGRDAAKLYRSRLPALPVRIHAPGPDDIWQAAEYKSAARISYADGFAAALAARLAARLITGDPDFESLKSLQVTWLKRH